MGFTVTLPTPGGGGASGPLSKPGRDGAGVSFLAGGSTGVVLYEGTLEQGQAKRFPISSRLWVRMGNPDALDITVAGKTVGGLPASPSNVVLTRSGAA